MESNNEKGYTIIDNFLPSHVIDKLYKLYQTETDWERLDQYRKDHYKHVFKFDRKELPSSDEAYRAKFWRSDVLKNNKEIIDIYKNEFVHRIESHLDIKMSHYDLSCMKCESGDYYRAHIDGWQGEYNSIFYVNKKWTWDWGGLLHIVEDKENGYVNIPMEELSAKQKEYQDFFKKALKKFDADSPADMDDEKKKEFFNYIDKNYKAKKETD